MAETSSERVIVVTGAAGGLGSIAAEHLAARGVKIVCVDRDADGVTAISEKLRAGGADVLSFAADVADERAVAGYVAATMDHWGRLDGLFNIAGYLGSPAPFLDTPIEMFDEVMRANVRGAWLGMKYVVPIMVGRGGGSIVNIGSYAAVRGSRYNSAYGASKHAIVGLSKTVALEHATDNVRVNVLNPGAMDTAMIRMMFPMHGGGDAAEGERLSKSRIPDNRLAQPSELAQTGIWLLLDAPEHLTGQVLSVDGGKTAA